MVRRLRCQHADRVLAGRQLLMEEFVLDGSMTSIRSFSFGALAARLRSPQGCSDARGA